MLGLGRLLLQRGTLSGQEALDRAGIEKIQQLLEGLSLDQWYNRSNRYRSSATYDGIQLFKLTLLVEAAHEKRTKTPTTFFVTV